MWTRDRVILAPDELTYDECLNLVLRVGGKVYGVKIHNFYDLAGPSVVKELKSAGARNVWVDYKLHDIPNTVGLRSHAIALSGADTLSVHASGGIEMMRRARENFVSGEIYAVTLLTSFNEITSEEVHGEAPYPLALRWAILAKRAGLTHVVCSSRELMGFSQELELHGMKYIVPGIRSEGQEAYDQGRVGTPVSALRNGALKIVIGRQITKAADPLLALEELEQEISYL